jgi:hypothetical protein
MGGGGESSSPGKAAAAFAAVRPPLTPAPPPFNPFPCQVIGNKWDTYLELLQAEYSERCV